MASLPTNLHEHLVQDITGPSAIIGSLSDHDSQVFYDHVIEKFALKLLIGADDNSEWSDGKSVIGVNDGPMHLLEAAFYAVKLEVQRRSAAAVCC